MHSKWAVEEGRGVGKRMESLLIGEGLTSSLVPLISYIFTTLPHQVTKGRALAA